MPLTKITRVGIEFQRKGSCNRCNGCLEDCTIDCPHGIVDGGGQPFCTIYNTRDQVCQECSSIRGRDVTHQNCIDYPDHPWVRVCRKGVCAFTFSRADRQSMDTLPWLDGAYSK